MNTKKPIISLTAKDFRWIYFNGSGNGGQNRNKRAVCVRCFHDPSGAMGVSQDERRLEQNKKLAFKRCTESEKFQKWIKLETMKKAGELILIEQQVEASLKKVKIEIKDENGKWIEWKDK